MVEISIIMPVYNSDKYLEKAIESILNQTYNNFELILVDDGSRDSSGEICDYYMKIDNRVKVIHQVNKGISAARNTGIKMAKGNYITFADNDDLFNKDLLEENLRLLKSESCDVVKFSVKYIEIDEFSNEKEIYRYNLKNKVYNKEELGLHYDDLRKSGVFTFVWNMIVKREIILNNNLLFDERIKFGGEDNKFNYELFKHINKLVCNEKKYYIHFRRVNHSTVVKYNINKAESSLLISDKENELINTLKVDKEKWFRYAAEYITFIALIIFDNRNDMVYQKQVEYMESILNYKQFLLDVNCIGWLKLISKSPKYALVAFCVYKRKFKLLYLISKLYEKVRCA